MSIESLLKLFEQYGWPGVMAIICILVVYYMISKKEKKNNDIINKNFNNLTETISKQNETLIDAITDSNDKIQNRMFDLICKTLDNRDKQKNDTHKLSLAKRQEVSKQINDILFDILLWSNAQRVSIVEFHNSKENLDGLSFLWYDMQYEKTERGVKSLSSKIKDSQATIIYPFVRRVNESESNIVNITPDDIENIYNESTILYEHLKKVNVSNMVCCGIYNNDNNDLIGMMIIEYHNGHIYNDELIDYYTLKSDIGVIEHLYNQARISLNLNK